MNYSTTENYSSQTSQNSYIAPKSGLESLVGTYKTDHKDHLFQVPGCLYCKSY